MADSEYKTLIVAAHADDAVVGVGGWAASCAGGLAVAFLTDGVPADPRYFAPGYYDPYTYGAVRQAEARAAWQQLRPGARLCFGTITDQQLTFELARAGAWIDRVLAESQPRRVLVPAFEGGHPDHDAANRLIAVHAGHLEIWEYALYSVWQGAELRQAFPDGPEPGCITGPALAAKRRALACYQSQQPTLAGFQPEREAMRPLPVHDYSRPARAEASVYERWGWPWRAQDMAARLASYSPL